MYESPTKGKESEVVSKIKESDKLLQAGFNTFSLDSLNRSVTKYGLKNSFDIEFKRLNLFKNYASQEKYEDAANNLKIIYPDQMKEELLVSKMSSEERGTFQKVKFERELREKTFYATIVNAQVVNLSTGATITGAQLGGVLGQANYIDSSNFKNYSAMSQVGAGLLGAIVGSMLDAPSVTKYKLTYLLQMANGDVKNFEKTQSTETHIPAGVCVEFREPSYLEVVNQNNCTEVKK